MSYTKKCQSSVSKLGLELNNVYFDLVDSFSEIRYIVLLDKEDIYKVWNLAKKLSLKEKKEYASE